MYYVNLSSAEQPARLSSCPKAGRLESVCSVATAERYQAHTLGRIEHGYANPAMLCGVYGSSSRAISSDLSVSSRAATASSMWCSFVAPTIGDVTNDFERTQASAT